MSSKPADAAAPGSRAALRTYLLAWTIGPIALVMAVNIASVYRTSLHASTAAHDRLLQATARQIGDMLEVDRQSLSIHVPLALIEALEGAGGSRMYYRVLGFGGEHVAGDTALAVPAVAPQAGASLSEPYVTTVAGQAVRVIGLQQPIETSQGQGVALILVGETLETRQAQAAGLLHGMVWRQLAWMLVIAVIVWLVVHRGLAPLEALRRELSRRTAGDTAGLASRGGAELQPVIDEMNALLARHQELLAQQRRFVADASHQLRTPMAALKTQLQSALETPQPPAVALADMLRTVDRATHLANQLLNKARIEAAGATMRNEPLQLDRIARDAVLELSPLIAARRLEFSLDAPGAVEVLGNPWMAGELVRNLLSNAIRHTPPGAALGIRLERHEWRVRMVVWDSGPGLGADAREWLFRPFASGSGVTGAGLGLAICLDIARSMHADIELLNRHDASGATQGLDAVVSWQDNDVATQAGDAF